MKTTSAIAVLAALTAPAAAFVAPLKAPRAMTIAPARSAMSMTVFDTAVADFKANFPGFYAKGWGPTTKAEIWNGRHVMAGWVALVATGYVQAHGLIPDFDQPLDLKEWGNLAILYGTTTITKGRAIILIAHVHALMVSICAAIAPLSFQDTLFLEDGEADAPPAGLIPSMDIGITRSAELWNGRVAMLGLIILVLTSLATGTPILNVIDAGLGGLLLKA